MFVRSNYSTGGSFVSLAAGPAVWEQTDFILTEMKMISKLLNVDP